MQIEIHFLTLFTIAGKVWGPFPVLDWSSQVAPGLVKLIYLYGAKSQIDYLRDPQRPNIPSWTNTLQKQQGKTKPLESLSRTGLKVGGQQASGLVCIMCEVTTFWNALLISKILWYNICLTLEMLQRGARLLENKYTNLLYNVSPYCTPEYCANHSSTKYITSFL